MCYQNFGRIRTISVQLFNKTLQKMVLSSKRNVTDIYVLKLNNKNSRTR